MYSNGRQSRTFKGKQYYHPWVCFPRSHLSIIHFAWWINIIWVTSMQYLVEILFFVTSFPWCSHPADPWFLDNSPEAFSLYISLLWWSQTLGYFPPKFKFIQWNWHVQIIIKGLISMMIQEFVYISKNTDIVVENQQNKKWAIHRKIIILLKEAQCYL